MKPHEYFQHINEECRESSSGEKLQRKVMKI